MHRTIWTLLLALLLQLGVGSAWAVRLPTAAACHEAVATVTADVHTHHAAHPLGNADHRDAHPTPTGTPHATDSHHCCVVGLGVGAQPQWVPLPHPAPEAPHRSWASLSLRPDLRPPI